ncbi:MAG: DNA translocase FtsK [Actinomycetota bacterium]
MAGRTGASGAKSKRSSSSSSAKKKESGARSSGSSKRGSKSAPKPSLASGLAGRRHEIIGLLLICIGVIAVLGIARNAAGPVGRGLDTALGVVLGQLRVVLPLAGAGLGLALLLERDDDQRADRLLAGGLLLVLGIAAGLHLLSGPDEIGGTAEELSDGGGIVGAVLGEPLDRLLAAGAWVVVVLVGAFGLVVLADRPIREVLVGVWGAVSGAARWTSDQLLRLASLDGDEPEPAPKVAAAPAPEPIAEPEPEPVPEPEPPKAPKVDLSQPITAEQIPLDLDERPARGDWKLPPLSVLGRSADEAVDEAAVVAGARTLQEALASHGVDTRVVGMTVGPTVTRYELELAPGVKVARVTSLNKDIAYAMASPDVRILAPIPGRSAIGVEVPNKKRQLVTIGDILTSAEAQASDKPLEVALGRDIAGRAVLTDLATMPHLLIAGATGAGKSSCINTMITSLLMRSTPDQVRLILVDPKMVEMGQYSRVPHLLTEVVTDPKKAANALAWACREMDRRYELLSGVGVRDIGGFNEAVAAGSLGSELPEELALEPLPYIVVVVDELNDLMMVAARDVEASITRIAQKARAVGIHLVIATQRPSVNVITGVIKANIPARLAFAVSSLADSRVILDQPGAERLVGKGDALLLGASSSTAQRIQGCWVEESEIRDVVGAWRRQAPDVDYTEGVEGADDEGTDVPLPGTDTIDLVTAPPAGDDDEDELITRAIDLVVRSQLGSTSMLQRKLRIGFARAGRVMDELEQRGVVGPSEGSKARTVLMSVQELDEQQSGRG